MNNTHKKLLAQTLLGLGIFVVLVVFTIKDQKSARFQDTIESDTYTFAEVIDGDTIAAWHDGQERILIRMIGINAPETGKGFREQECFGDEATEHLEEILGEDPIIHITTDPTQDTYDRYDRLLGYVWTGDENLNEKMVRDGYAYEYTYAKPYQYQHEFIAAQKHAQQENLGLWATCQDI